MTVETGKPTGRRSPKGERTREKLLQAAKEIFEEHGFVESRISDIAERAGLSYGTFYHYFLSKEEVFREVTAYHERRLGEAVAAEMALVDPAQDSFAARLEAANRGFLAGYREEARLMRVIEQVSRSDVTLDKSRLDRHKVYADGLADAIRALQRDGKVDPAIEPEIGSQLLMALVTRFAESWFVQGQIDCTFEHGVDQLNRLYLNAMGMTDRGANS